MKFPRSTHLFRGQLDLAPFLCVLFLLAFALVMRDFLVLPRGARLRLPAGQAPVAGVTGEPRLIVAVDSARRLYFENQISSREALEVSLARRVGHDGVPPALLIQADQDVPYGELAELASMAWRAGLREIVFGVGAPRSP